MMHHVGERRDGQGNVDKGSRLRPAEGSSAAEKGNLVRLRSKTLGSQQVPYRTRFCLNDP